MQKVTLAPGDGIGPEITSATLKILKAAKVPLEFEEVKVGKEVFESGNSSGLGPECWESIHRNNVILKGPITTPQGGGYKSLNVTLRASLGLFANIRQCKTYAPFIKTHHPEMNVVIIRENEEDTYSGIEHRQSQEVAQTLKLISRPGSEAIIRYAFEYAKAHGRKLVTCMSKDNIMKLTDGLFHRVFNEIAVDYPEIKSDHQIIDIGAANLAAHPESLDVIVTQNLYGDIISDIAAQIAGSVGLAGSANIGKKYSMFEAIHGSAPDISGKNIANPSGLLSAAIMMLTHLGISAEAEQISNAWLCTLEDGIHTGDIFTETLSKEKVSTSDFANAIIERLGKKPEQLTPVSYKTTKLSMDFSPSQELEEKTLIGCDVFLEWREEDRSPEKLARKVEALSSDALPLSIITNRGVKVYPAPPTEAFKSDHWRCRFLTPNEQPLDYVQILELLAQLHKAQLDILKTEHLYLFSGKEGFSRAQG